MPSSPTTLLIARHGQSEWNAVFRWQGQADPPLTNLGERQATAAARAIGAVDAIWSSDLIRAQHTAAIISEWCGVGPVQVTPLLRERDAGAWTGLTRPEIERKFPGFLDDGRRPEGWESNEDLVKRASAGLEAIANGHDGGTVLVVAHSGLIYAIEETFGEPHVRLPNLGARAVVYGPAGNTLQDRIDLLEGQVVEQTFNDQL